MMALKKHIFLMYCGRSADGKEYRRWDPVETETLVAYREGQKTTPFFPAFLLLAIKSGQGGDLVPGFGNMGTKEDWLAWLDDIFLPGANLAALAHSVRKHSLPPVDIWVAVPYPDPRQKYFGRTWDRALSFSLAKDRESAVRWWLSRFLARWHSAVRAWKAERCINLKGFYWGRESMTPQDRLLLPRVISHIRSLGYRSMWIPYYAATPFLNITNPGFDITIIQPSYMQDPSAERQRLSAAAARARKYGAGIEIEFDTGALNEGSREYNKALDYLNRGLPQFDGYGSRGYVAYYTGYKTVVSLCRLNSPLYSNLYRFVTGIMAKVDYPGIEY